MKPPNEPAHIICESANGEKCIIARTSIGLLRLEIPRGANVEEYIEWIRKLKPKKNYDYTGRDK